MLTDDFLILKWGRLKSCNLTSEKGRDLVNRYCAERAPLGALTGNDTPEMRDLICQMIDECNAATIHLALDPDGVNVTKDEAKRYVVEYGKRELAND